MSARSPGTSGVRRVREDPRALPVARARPALPDRPAHRGAGATGAAGAPGASAATPETLTLLSDNFGSFGSPAWTDQPAGLTELFGTTVGRLKADLTSAAQVRLIVSVATGGAAGAAIRAQYSTDQSSWNYLDGATGPSVTVNTTGLKVSAWVNVTGAAKADVFIRVVGISGNGTRRPRVRQRPASGQVGAGRRWARQSRGLDTRHHDEQQERGEEYRRHEMGVTQCRESARGRDPAHWPELFDCLHASNVVTRERMVVSIP